MDNLQYSQMPRATSLRMYLGVTDSRIFQGCCYCHLSCSRPCLTLAAEVLEQHIDAGSGLSHSLVDLGSRCVCTDLRRSACGL